MAPFTFPRELLQQQTVDILKKVASELKVGLGPVPKAQLVDFLTDYLSKKLPELVQGLTTKERLFLAEAAYGNGYVDPDIFQAKYGRRAPSLPTSVRRWEKEVPVGKTAKFPAFHSIFSEAEPWEEEELDGPHFEILPFRRRRKRPHTRQEPASIGSDENPSEEASDVGEQKSAPSAASGYPSLEKEPDETDVIARQQINYGKDTYERITYRGPTYLLTLFFERPSRFASPVMPAGLRDKLRKLLPKPPALECPSRSELPSHQTMTLEVLSTKTDVDIRVFAGESQVFAEISRVLAIIRNGKVKVSPATGRPTPAGLKALAGALVLPEWNLAPSPEASQDPKKRRPRPGNYTLPMPGGRAIVFHDIDADESEGTSTSGTSHEEAESLDVSEEHKNLPGRAYAWSIVVQQAQWAKPKGSTLVLTKLGETVAAGPTPEDLRPALRLLELDQDWDELSQVMGLRGLKGKGQRWLLPLADRRWPIMQTLRELPIGKWVSIADFERFMLALGHRLAVAEDDRGVMSLYFGSASYGYLTDEETLGRWILRVFLMQRLAPLGVIDIGYTNPHALDPELGSLWGTDDHDFFTPCDGLLYVRLTNLGAYCLGKADTYEAPVVERPRYLRVLPNLEIVPTKLAAAPLEDALFLDRFAKRQGSTWVISPASLLAFLEEGGKLDEIPRFLEQRADQALPDTVRQLLTDTGRRATVLGEPEAALLIPVNDTHVAHLIAHDPKAREVCRLAGDRHLVVLEKNRRGFAAALRRLGFLPPPALR